jgi:hypothetical protein
VGVVLWGSKYSFRRCGQHRSALAARSHRVERQRAFSEPRSSAPQDLLSTHAWLASDQTLACWLPEFDSYRRKPLIYIHWKGHL